jgi:hypothetical protein
MLHSSPHRFLDLMTALFFVVVASLLVIFGTQVQYHDGNYAAFYLGFGVLLESVYLATHFGLAAFLISRPKLAETISQILGLLLMLPVVLIILVLTLLLEQAIRTNVRNEVDVTVTNWVFGSLILLLLVVPSVLICRNIIASFLDQRVEKAERTGR